jgi:hypothetical protein
MVSKQFKARLHILTKNRDAKTNPLITFQVCYQERGPLSLVTIIEELLDRKVAAPV